MQYGRNTGRNPRYVGAGDTATRHPTTVSTATTRPRATDAAEATRGRVIKGGGPMTTMRLAHREATRKPVREIATELQDALGQRLVAYGCAIRSPKLVGRWATGEHDPRDDAAARLRMLYRVYFCFARMANTTTRLFAHFFSGPTPISTTRPPSTGSVTATAPTPCARARLF